MKTFLPSFLTATLALLCAFVGLANASADTAKPGAPTFKRGVNIANWLSQNDESMPYAGTWFNEEDIAWISTHGFDHIRFPIDSRIWLKTDGTLDESKVAPFDQALVWVRKYHLGAILDVHFIDGADFNSDAASDTRVFTSPELMHKAEKLWRTLATRYAKEGVYLRFEVLNEPKAELNSQLNTFNLKMLAAIRESNPTRVVYFPCNKWNTIPNVVDLELPANDKNVAVTVHFYEPIVFTHQKAPWAFAAGDKMPAVPFPGKVPDLTGIVTSDNPMAKSLPSAVSIEKDIDPMFEKLAAWAKTKGVGREILLGEFGVYYKVDPASTIAWTRAVRRACDRYGVSWNVWAYQGVFPVRKDDGSPAPMLEGLMQEQ